MSDIQQFNLNKIFIAIPLIVIFFANIFITQLRGLSFIGEIAMIAGVTSLIAILIGHRSDIAILSNSENRALLNLAESIKGIALIILFLIPFLFFLYFLGIKIEYLLIAILSCVFAINDSVSSFYIRNGNFYFYSFFKSMPSLILLISAYFINSPEMSWIISYVISLIILSFLTFNLLKDSNLKFNFFSIANYLITKIVPTITALICATGTVFWLFIITSKTGSESAGIWSNVYRIFSLPLIFLTATYLPLVLLKLGDLKKTTKKINQMNKFSIIYISLSCAIIFFAFIAGPEIFIKFTGSDVRLSVSLLITMIMFAIFKNFLGYHQSFFQTLQLDFVLLIILILEIIAAGIIYFWIEANELQIIVNYIFSITGICAFILLIFLIGLSVKYYLFNPNDSIELK